MVVIFGVTMRHKLGVVFRRMWSFRNDEMLVTRIGKFACGTEEKANADNCGTN